MTEPSKPRFLRPELREVFDRCWESSKIVYYYLAECEADDKTGVKRTEAERLAVAYRKMKGDNGTTDV